MPEEVEFISTSLKLVFVMSTPGFCLLSSTATHSKFSPPPPFQLFNIIKPRVAKNQDDTTTTLLREMVCIFFKSSASRINPGISSHSAQIQQFL